MLCTYSRTQQCRKFCLFLPQRQYNRGEWIFVIFTSAENDTLFFSTKEELTQTEKKVYKNSVPVTLYNPQTSLSTYL